MVQLWLDSPTVFVFNELSHFEISTAQGYLQLSNDRFKGYIVMAGNGSARIAGIYFRSFGARRAQISRSRNGLRLKSSKAKKGGAGRSAR